MSLQPFKVNDTTETKVTDAFLNALDPISDSLDDFFEGAYQCHLLGGVLWDLRLSPLAGAISREIFIQSFFALHNNLSHPGTFEFFLEIFRAVWGETVEVEFTIPAPGKLLINVTALSGAVFTFSARDIVDDEYVYDDVIDHEDPFNYIGFQGVTGLKTQDEVDTLMREISTQGIWTVATLVT